MTKTTKILLSLAMFAGIIGCSDGMVATYTTNALITPDYAYEIDTWGGNSEIYEFTPQSAPNMTCVMYMLDSGKAMGLQCFPKSASAQ